MPLGVSFFFLFVPVRIDGLERVKHMAQSRKSNWRGVRGAGFCHGLSGAVLVTAAIGVLTAPTTATIITLSTHSSDETDPALLSATLDFSVVGNMLTLTMINDTLGENGFNINRLYFNGGGGVTGLALDSGPSGWGLEFDQHAGGFGTFGFALIGGVGRNGPTVAPGEMVTFIFSIAGAGTEPDFTTNFSTLPPGSIAAIAAAKFVMGPGDDSAFGAFVPAPGTLALLGLAGVVGLGRRRRPT